MRDKYYLTRYVFDKRRSVVWKEIARFESKFIPKSGSVIDLGAGYCDFINNIEAQKKYAVDTSVEFPDFAAKEVEILSKKAWELSVIPNGTIDVIHASNLLEHFDDDELGKTMKEIKRVLKTGGKLILMQPNYRLSSKKYFDDPTHKKIFSDLSLESFLRSHNFKILLKMPRFLPFSMRSNSFFIPNFILPFIVRVYIHSPFKPFAGQMLFVSENL